MPSSRSSNFVVLRHRNVALTLGAQFTASAAWSAQIVATGFLLYEATGSKAALGLLGLVEFIPVISLVFITGPFADRRDRRTISAVCVAAEAVVALDSERLDGDVVERKRKRAAQGAENAEAGLVGYPGRGPAHGSGSRTG